MCYGEELYSFMEKKTRLNNKKTNRFIVLSLVKVVQGFCLEQVDLLYSLLL